MNMSNEERFHELAHKALSKEAQASEREELQALIAENPKLKEDFEQMGAETAAAREILPLLENIAHPQGRIPPPPMARLQKAIRGVFESRPESAGELRELLARLERWSSRRVGAEQDRLKELMAFLRESLSAQSGASVVAPMATLHSPQVRHRSTPMLRLDVMACALDEARAETRPKEDEEMEHRLRALEARIRQAEEISQECRDEVSCLLEAFAHIRGAKAERSRQTPKSAAPEG